MKTRLVWLLFGLAFFVTLAIIVGQRLSAEAMAVVVGVMAGVAASIPTSLIVVWIATRSVGQRSDALARPLPEAPTAEPRIIVVAPPLAAAQSGYAPAGPMALSPFPVVPRRFTVIGGGEALMDRAAAPQEVLWTE